jgi:endoglucanase
MKSKTVSLTIACLGLSLAVSVLHEQSPVAPPEIPGKAVYIPFPVDIKLDGKLDDWSNIPFITVDQGTLVSKDPAEDGSLRFAVAANDDTLFLTASMVDKNIITGKHGTSYWNEDSIEFYLNLNKDFGLTAYNENVFQLRIIPGDIGNTDPAKITLTGTNTENIDVKAFVFKTGDGWGFEAAIDLKGRIALAHGQEIGFQMQGNGASVQNRDVKLIWSAADTKDTSYLDPSVFGRGIFFKVGSTDVPTPSAVQAATATATPAEPGSLPRVSVNQVGYFASYRKLGFLASPTAGELKWSLVDTATNQEVANGTTSKGVFDNTSGDTLHAADFSSFITPGIYKLVIDGIASAPFEIADAVYSRLKKDALAYFYRNRSGIELKPEYAGPQWARPAGHLSDNRVTCFKGKDASGKTWDGCNYTINGIGGWYDAGDYGKYVVNGGIAAWTLMNLFERNPEAFPDGSLDIPENKNGVPDILDEARWEMQFLLEMQIPQGKPLAGMAFHKLHDRKWSGVPSKLPTQYDNNLDFSKPDQGRYVYEPTTAATLNLAATAAQCARLWKDLDPQFSSQCLTAAKTAWVAAMANPKLLAGSVPGDGGGDYTDDNVDDEFYWAAAELFITTYDKTYLDFVKSSKYFRSFPGLESGSVSAMGWGDTAALGTISLAIMPNDLGEVGTGLSQADVNRLRGQIVATAERYLKTATSEGYRVPIPEAGYVWESNSLVLNNAIILALAYDFSGKVEYINGVIDSMDYILGRNALNKSFVSGYGTNPMQHPHHRFWGNAPALGFPPPPPGALAGGPNGAIQDPAAQAANLDKLPTAKRYLDELASYSMNEVAINWNAPLAWVANYLDQRLGWRPISGVGAFQVNPAVPSDIQGLRVSGNMIVNGANQPVRLLGVNRSGGEYMCIQDRGIWDGPVDSASVHAMLAWHINVVRVPLNEDCWLSINGVNPAYGGENYQKVVVDFVNLLNSNGLIVILELHWSAPGTTPATKQAAMPDSDHTLAFWQSVATTFKSNSAVIFDLFNSGSPIGPTIQRGIWSHRGTLTTSTSARTRIVGTSELRLSCNRFQWLRVKLARMTVHMGTSRP